MTATCDCDDCRFITRGKWYGLLSALALVTAVWLTYRRGRR